MWKPITSADTPAEPADLSWREAGWPLAGKIGTLITSRDGGVSREIRIKLDPARLAASGVTAAQVSNQLRW